MLLVRTRVALSPIEGLGVFADEDIRKGTPTWRFVPGLDQTLDPSFVEGLPSIMKEFCLRYSYLSERLGLYVLCGDGARFMNHASDPNTEAVRLQGELEDLDVAARDIARGEELTCNYWAFDKLHAAKLFPEVEQLPLRVG